jgi:hypothetical protein
MSWYNRKPRLKDKPKTTPHHYSPAHEKIMEEIKNRVGNHNSIEKRSKQ